MTFGVFQRDIRGIFLHEKDLGNLSQTHSILHAVGRFRELGVHLRCGAASTPEEISREIDDRDDFILVTTGSAKKPFPPLESVLSIGLPTFVVSRGAAASVREGSREVLEDPRVTRLIRNTNLHDPSLNNFVTKEARYRYHVALLNQDAEGSPLSPRETPIQYEDLSKLETGYTLATYPKMDLVERSRLSVNSINRSLLSLKAPLHSIRKNHWTMRENRPFDISFVGSATHGAPVIAAHRKRAAAALERIKRNGYSVYVALTKTAEAPKYSNSRFYRIMRQSKAVLSPWGFGEVCWRDFETVLSGAILIKPDMSHCVTNPPVFVENETYFPCRRDFADLEKVVERVVSRWKSLRSLREHALEVLVRARRPEVIAAQLTAILKRGLVA